MITLVNEPNNKQQSRARTIVDSLYGRLKDGFRCLFTRHQTVFNISVAALVIFNLQTDLLVPCPAHEILLDFDRFLNPIFGAVNSYFGHNIYIWIQLFRNSIEFQHSPYGITKMRYRTKRVRFVHSQQVILFVLSLLMIAMHQVQKHNIHNRITSNV